MDAPRGSVELVEAEELERLRRRAYGPDADIAGDAAAQARLSELEAGQRRQATSVGGAAAKVPAPVPEPVEGSRSASTPVPKPVDGALAEHEPVGELVTEQDPAEAPIADSGPVAGAPAAPWWRQRRWLVILGGAIAALSLIAALATWISQLLADESAPTTTVTSTAQMPPVPDGFGREYYVPSPDHVLAVKSVGADPDRPNDRHGILNAVGISRDELTRFEDFVGHPDARILNVWSGESRYGMTCLFVAVPVQGIREGRSADACSPDGMVTIAELGMGGDRLTQFVLEGDHVDVYVYERAPDPSASQG